MYPHHEQAIQRLRARYEPDPAFHALIIGGSIAKGWATATSDVDFMLVATEAEYQRRLAAHQLTLFDTSLTDYEGGYVDGKIVDVAFMREVAERGSEPARSAFARGILVYNHLPAIPDLIQQITVYPEAERTEKMQAFYSQVMMMNWYVGEGEKRHDPYLLTYMAGDMVLFAARLILAYNRVLYPYHKWLMRTLAETPDQPADLIPNIHALLAQPGRATAQALFDCVTAFQDWGVDLEHAVAAFLHDREWNWRHGRPPLHDW